MATGQINRHGMAEPNDVTLPYRPTADGIMNILLFLESGGAAAYCYISVAGTQRAAFMGTANGGKASICLPVRSGQAVTVAAESGIQSKLIQFFPIY